MITETKEAVHGLVKVTRLIIKKAEGGLQPSEILEIAGTLVTDPEFRDAVVKAIAGAQKIPAEIAGFKIDDVLAFIEAKTA